MSKLPTVDIVSEAFWEASADGLVLVDVQGIIRATNPALDRLFGYAPGALEGQSIETLVPPAFRSTHVADRASYEEKPVNRPMGAHRQLEGMRADGSMFPVNISLARIGTSEGDMTFAAVRDLTDRVAVENELARANHRRAIAEDHDRIASELHDTVIQRLFVLGLGLQGLPNRIADDVVASKVYEAVDTIDDIIREIRTTIYGLRHSADPTEGIRQRVIRIVNEMEPALGFTPELRFVGAVEAINDADLVSQMVPVIREALSNIARHSGARHAVITLRVDDALTLVVFDDGEGIRDDAPRSGLANLAERAVALGGTFTIGRHPKGGTELCWSVPAVLAT